MPRRAGDVQIQLSVGPELRRALGIATLNHEADVPTKPRMMDRGRMVVLVMEWFLKQGEDEQLRILLEGLRHEGERKQAKAEVATGDVAAETPGSTKQPAADRSKSFVQSYVDPNAPDGSTLGSYEVARKRRMPGKDRVPDGQGGAVGK